MSIECPSIIPIFSGGSGGEHDCEDNLHSAGQWSDGALAKVGLKLASSWPKLAQGGSTRHEARVLGGFARVAFGKMANAKTALKKCIA